jgi:predicted HNH restriction endonuclease
MDPAVDLRPVCPSCHAVIHLRDPPYTIDDVKKFIFQQRSLLEHKEGR